MNSEEPSAVSKCSACGAEALVWAPDCWLCGRPLYGEPAAVQRAGTGYDKLLAGCLFGVVAVFVSAFIAFGIICSTAVRW
jgi:hypothetical protein